MPDSANSNAEAETYDMRPDDEGLTVYNVRTGEPARVRGVPQTGIEMEKADDLVDLLNCLARRTGERFSI